MSLLQPVLLISITRTEERILPQTAETPAHINVERFERGCSITLNNFRPVDSRTEPATEKPVYCRCVGDGVVAQRIWDNSDYEEEMEDRLSHNASEEQSFLNVREGLLSSSFTDDVCRSVMIKYDSRAKREENNGTDASMPPMMGTSISIDPVSRQDVTVDNEDQTALRSESIAEESDKYCPVVSDTFLPSYMLCEQDSHSSHEDTSSQYSDEDLFDSSEGQFSNSHHANEFDREDPIVDFKENYSLNSSDDADKINSIENKIKPEKANETNASLLPQKPDFISIKPTRECITGDQPPLHDRILPQTNLPEIKLSTTAERCPTQLCDLNNNF